MRRPEKGMLGAAGRAPWHGHQPPARCLHDTGLLPGRAQLGLRALQPVLEGERWDLWDLSVSRHLFPSQKFLIFFLWYFDVWLLKSGEHQLFWRNRLRVRDRQCGQSAPLGFTYLFVGPFMSVHLHHPLTEHVKRVFFVLLPVGAQPLPF